MSNTTSKRSTPASAVAEGGAAVTVAAPEETGAAVEVGIVGKAHGLRGAFKVHLHNPASSALDRPDALVLRRPTGPPLEGLKLEGVVGGVAVMRIAGIADCDAAEALKGALVVMSRDAIDVADGQYLYADLIGCQVCEGDRALGRVASVFEAGASDVLVVHDGDDERLIPLVEPWVASVDLRARRIEVVDADEWEAQRVRKE